MDYHPKHRFLFRLAAALLILFGTFCGRFLYGLHAENGAMQEVLLPAHPRVPAGASVLVIAPHCDDETLGAGGLIADAVRRGTTVSVAFVTNGDGFPMAVSREYRRISPGPADYERMARQRQGEARAALAHLGVPSARIYFLGYPDRGIAELWNHYWSPESPFTSRYTGCSASPYGNSFHRGAVYCGQDLTLDIESLLRKVRPQWLYLPHPADDHPDHWATYCFAAAALEGLRDAAPGATGADAEWGRVQVYSYLVHHGDWPVPQGLRREARLVPPAPLAHLDTSWSSLPLSPAEEAAKEAALLCYRSQTAVMKRFLLSFIRRDELFGALPPAELRRPERRPAPYQIAITDATDDTLLRRLEGRGDLTGVEASLTRNYLRLRVSARLPLSPRLTYVVRLHPLGGSAGDAPLTLPFDHLRCQEPGVEGQCDGSVLEASIPLSRLGYPAAVLVGADTRLGRVPVDRVAWRLLRLPRRPAAAPVIAARRASPVGQQGANRGAGL